AHCAGFQLSFHVPDLSMLEGALDALDHVVASTTEACRRPRLEHCPLCPPFLLTRLSGAGAVVVPQPNLLFSWGTAHRHPADWILPLNALMRAGIAVAFGSDSPLTSSSPFAAIRTAVTRRLADGAVLAPGEGITPAQAIGLYTAGPAFAGFEEDLKGAIAPGLLADLAVLDRDPLALPADEMAETEVAATILDGRVVWQRGS
ncbi:MAG TPA: amidohydrolase family protein, partial [Rhodospirillaceae bacterium]|nr:amidohydrolase family protein [Rhodospirillaceae bacterium]